MENLSNFKEVEIKGRKFVVRKFDARTGAFMLIKVTGILGPMFKGIDISKIKVEEGKTPDLKGINIASVVSELSSLTEQDFNYIHDTCLKVCFETLPAGNTRVLHDNGNFAVMGLDTDSATTLALVAHALIFNVQNFFFRKPLRFTTWGINEFEPVHCENVDEWLFAPIMAGFWTHRDLIDKVFTLDDLLDAHEMLAVKYENERRASEVGRKGQC